jgi:transcriptional antiterminator RfaH
MQLIRHTQGITSLVNFGPQIPPVPDQVILDLRQCFEHEDTIVANDQPVVGDDVTVGSGAFFGMRAVVLRSWPAKRRVQILLDILGRPTPIEVDSSLVMPDFRPMSRVLPALAAGSGVGT